MEDEIKNGETGCETCYINIHGLCNKELVSKEIVDGLIIFSALMAYLLPEKKMLDLFDKFEDIPCVCISMPINKIISILIDNSGIGEIVSHLIEKHEYKKIAFIKGPESTPESMERYKSYIQTLDEYNIPVDDNLIVPGEFSEEAGEKAVEILLDKRKVKLDAIVAADDQTAFGVYNALCKRGIRIPHDIAVTGFDDSIESNYIIPPLTTVSQPYHEQSVKALETLVALIAGKDISGNITLTSKIVIRQSCGCLPDSVKQIKNNESSLVVYKKIKEVLFTNKSKIISSIKTEIYKLIINNKLYSDLINNIFNSLLKNIDNKGKKDFFIDNVNRAIIDLFNQKQDVMILKNIISSLKDKILKYISNEKSIEYIEYIFQKAHVLINEMLLRIEMRKKENLEDLYWKLNQFSRILISVIDFDLLLDKITELVPLLNINTFYLSLYDTSKKYIIGQEWQLPKWSNLILAYNNGRRINLKDNDIRFKTTNMLPNCIWPDSEQFELIAMPLFFNEEHFGFILFDYGEKLDLIYESLRGSISSGLKEVFLFKDLQTTKETAEAANKAKSDFVANISHEIRTPMNTVLGYTDLLMESEENSEKKNMLRTISSDGKKLLKLVNGILDFSKLEAGKMQYINNIFSFKTILTHIENLFLIRAREKEIKFIVSLDDSVPEFVYGDERKIEQIIINLTGNAFKFTSSGSIYITCKYNKSNNTGIISVKDTGIGIPEEKKESIFYAFNQVDTSSKRKYSGTGLGLAITRQFIEQMGGSIFLNTMLGSFSEFIVELPLKEIKRKIDIKELADNNESQNKSKYISKKCKVLSGKLNFRILIVEDDRMNQVLVGKFLDELDVAYEFASNGKIAIEILEKTINLPDSMIIDLLLVDIQMPVMDGMETIKYIRSNKNFKHSYAIALTAHAIKGYEEKCINAGFDDYISKPLDKNILYKKIYSLMLNKNQTIEIP